MIPSTSSRLRAATGAASAPTTTTPTSLPPSAVAAPLLHHRHRGRPFVATSAKRATSASEEAPKPRKSTTTRKTSKADEEAAPKKRRTSTASKKTTSADAAAAPKKRRASSKSKAADSDASPDTTSTTSSSPLELLAALEPATPEAEAAAAPRLAEYHRALAAAAGRGDVAAADAAWADLASAAASLLGSAAAAAGPASHHALVFARLRAGDLAGALDLAVGAVGRGAALPSATFCALIHAHADAAAAGAAGAALDLEVVDALLESMASWGHDVSEGWRAAVRALGGRAGRMQRELLARASASATTSSSSSSSSSADRQALRRARLALREVAAECVRRAREGMENKGWTLSSDAAAAASYLSALCALGSGTGSGATPGGLSGAAAAGLYLQRDLLGLLGADEEEEEEGQGQQQQEDGGGEAAPATAPPTPPTFIVTEREHIAPVLRAMAVSGNDVEGARALLAALAAGGRGARAKFEPVTARSFNAVLEGVIAHMPAQAARERRARRAAEAVAAAGGLGVGGRAAAAAAEASRRQQRRGSAAQLEEDDEFWQGGGGATSSAPPTATVASASAPLPLGSGEEVGADASWLLAGDEDGAGGPGAAVPAGSLSPAEEAELARGEVLVEEFLSARTDALQLGLRPDAGTHALLVAGAVKLGDAPRALASLDALRRASAAGGAARLPPRVLGALLQFLRDSDRPVDALRVLAAAQEDGARLPPGALAAPPHSAGAAAVASSASSLLGGLDASGTSTSSASSSDRSLITSWITPRRLKALEARGPGADDDFGGAGDDAADGGGGAASSLAAELQPPDLGDEISYVDEVAISRLGPFAVDAWGAAVRLTKMTIRQVRAEAAARGLAGAKFAGDVDGVKAGGMKRPELVALLREARDRAPLATAELMDKRARRRDRAEALAAFNREQQGGEAGGDGATGASKGRGGARGGKKAGGARGNKERVMAVQSWRDGRLVGRRFEVFKPEEQLAERLQRMAAMRASAAAAEGGGGGGNSEAQQQQPTPRQKASGEGGLGAFAAYFRADSRAARTLANVDLGASLTVAQLNQGVADILALSNDTLDDDAAGSGGPDYASAGAAGLASAGGAGSGAGRGRGRARGRAGSGGDEDEDDDDEDDGAAGGVGGVGAAASREAAGGAGAAWARADAEERRVAAAYAALEAMESQDPARANASAGVGVAMGLLRAAEALGGGGRRGDLLALASAARAARATRAAAALAPRLRRLFCAPLAVSSSSSAAPPDGALVSALEDLARMCVARRDLDAARLVVSHLSACLHAIASPALPEDLSGAFPEGPPPPAPAPPPLPGAAEAAAAATQQAQQQAAAAVVAADAAAAAARDDDEDDDDDYEDDEFEEEYEEEEDEGEEQAGGGQGEAAAAATTTTTALATTLPVVVPIVEPDAFPEGEPSLFEPVDYPTERVIDLQLVEEDDDDAEDDEGGWVGDGGAAEDDDDDEASFGRRFDARLGGHQRSLEGPELWAAIMRGEDPDPLARAEEDAALAALREQLASEAAQEEEEGEDGGGDADPSSSLPPGTTRQGLAAWAMLSADLRALTGCADPALAAARAPPALLARLPSLARAAPQLRRWAREADAAAQHRAARVRRLAAAAAADEGFGIGSGDDLLAAHPRLLRAVEAAEAGAAGALGGWSSRQRAALAAADRAAEALRRKPKGLTPEAAAAAVIDAAVEATGNDRVDARLFGGGPAGADDDGVALGALSGGGGRLLAPGRRAEEDDEVEGGDDDEEDVEEEEEDAEASALADALQKGLASLREAAAAAAEEADGGDDAEENRELRAAVEQRLRLRLNSGGGGPENAALVADPSAVGGSLVPARTAAATRRVQQLLRQVGKGGGGGALPPPASR